MNQFKIRLNKTNSVNSVNKDNMVDVELQQTTNPYMFTTDIKDTIDQYEVFEAERAYCTNYRLITTIKPFCSNVLYNPITEIVYKEGKVEIIDDENIKVTIDSTITPVDGWKFTGWLYDGQTYDTLPIFFNKPIYLEKVELVAQYESV